MKSETAQQFQKCETKLKTERRCFDVWIFPKQSEYVSVVVPCCPSHDVQEMAVLIQVVSCVHPAWGELIARRMWATRAVGNFFPTHVPVMQALDEFASFKKKKLKKNYCVKFPPILVKCFADWQDSDSVCVSKERLKEEYILAAPRKL